MNAEQGKRKRDLQHRLLRRQYPVRYDLLTSYHISPFTDENDHNPLVLEDCPRCKGSGRICESFEDEQGRACEGLAECEVCEGQQTTWESVRCFPDPGPALTAHLDAAGWLRCPGCGIRFSSQDARVWTGGRHKTCGQRILLEASKP